MQSLSLAGKKEGLGHFLFPVCVLHFSQSSFFVLTLVSLDAATYSRDNLQTVSFPQHRAHEPHKRVRQHTNAHIRALVVYKTFLQRWLQIRTLITSQNLNRPT